MRAESVSCVVPVHNGVRYLAHAIDSVLEQSCPPGEVVVVDDGSTDGSADAIAAYGDAVTYVHQEHRGPAAARNHGVARTHGELVAFVDQDDWWHPEKLERQLECFAADPALDLCVAHAELRWEVTKAAEGSAYRDHPRGQRVPALTTPALLARRTAFDRVGPLDEALRFADATDWILRAIDHGLRLVVHPDVLLYHRMHDANLTRQRHASGAEYVRLVKATLDRRRAAEARS
jgi:glycosyltransferase involved in cell wall biosynthesis